MVENTYELILKRLDEIDVLVRNNELRLEKLEDIVLSKKPSLIKLFFTLSIITMVYCVTIMVISFALSEIGSEPFDLAIFVSSFLIWEFNNVCLDNAELFLDKEKNLSPENKKHVFQFRLIILAFISTITLIIIFNGLSLIFTT